LFVRVRVSKYVCVCVWVWVSVRRRLCDGEGVCMLCVGCENIAVPPRESERMCDRIPLARRLQRFVLAILLLPLDNIVTPLAKTLQRNDMESKHTGESVRCEREKLRD
jgi:hypothetical protein